VFKESLFEEMLTIYRLLSPEESFFGIAEISSEDVPSSTESGWDKYSVVFATQ
jgi:hypothetical protein